MEQSFIHKGKTYKHKQSCCSILLQNYNPDNYLSEQTYRDGAFKRFLYLDTKTNLSQDVLFYTELFVEAWFIGCSQNIYKGKNTKEFAIQHMIDNMLEFEFGG